MSETKNKRKSDEEIRARINDEFAVHKSDDTNNEWIIELLDRSKNGFTIEGAKKTIDNLEEAIQSIDPFYNINQIKIKDIKGFQSNSDDIKIWNVYYRTESSNDLKIALVGISKDKDELYMKIFELEHIPIELLDKLTRVIHSCKNDLFNLKAFAFQKKDFILEYCG